MKLLDKMLAKEEINGERCPTYLYRWRLLNLFGCKVYLHHFIGNDWTKDLHDHPKRFITIGLTGSYTEETPEGERQVYRSVVTNVSGNASAPATRYELLDSSDYA